LAARTVSQAGYDLIKGFEGLSLVAYQWVSILPFSFQVLKTNNFKTETLAESGRSVTATPSIRMEALLGKETPLLSKEPMTFSNTGWMNQ
jgi:hypothetical protein